MAKQIPVLHIGSPDDGWSETLAGLDAFPLVETDWSGAKTALNRVQPEAVLVTDCTIEAGRFDAFAAMVKQRAPYLPLIVINPPASLQAANLVALTLDAGDTARLAARMASALRVRNLHASVLRRSETDTTVSATSVDPLSDATVLLLGRGSSYPALSVALGSHVGVIGALSVEAAARHLGSRDIDGVVIGDGFGTRMIDGFLTVLAQDARFRDLPVLLAGQVARMSVSSSLDNLEFAADAPSDRVVQMLGLFRQHALSARLGRAIDSIDAGGLVEARTGLFGTEAFSTNFASAVSDALRQGTAFSAARIVIDAPSDRHLFGAARIVSRLMRRMDFACLADGPALHIAFPATDLRNAHMVARRLASVIRQTLHEGTTAAARVDPVVTIVTLMPGDTASSLEERLQNGTPAPELKPVRALRSVFARDA